MKPIQEHPEWFGRNRYGVPFSKLDLLKQVRVVIDALGRTHRNRMKVVGSTHKKHRAATVTQFIGDVRRAGYQLKSVLNLDQRHVQAAVESWRSKNHAPGTIQARLSILRWFVAAIGKGGMIKPAECYGLSTEEVRRDYVARADKSWTTRGSIPEVLIQKATDMDKWVGTHLSLMAAFGLRVSEAILIRPHQSHNGAVLTIEEGTKGGRTRVIRIRTEEQAKILGDAKALASQSRQRSLVPPGKTPEQARRRLYYVCERLGITKEKLEITPHGLRHEYANDLYEEVSGTPSVVRGSSVILDMAAEDAALEAVTRDLGHKRISIVAAYTGPRKRRERSSRARDDDPDQAAVSADEVPK